MVELEKYCSGGKLQNSFFRPTGRGFRAPPSRPEAKIHENSLKHVMCVIKTLSIDSTHGYSIPVKFQDDLTIINGLTGEKSNIFMDFGSESGPGIRSSERGLYILYIGSKKSCELDFDQLVLGAQMELEKKLDM